MNNGEIDFNSGEVSLQDLTTLLQGEEVQEETLEDQLNNFGKEVEEETEEEEQETEEETVAEKTKPVKEEKTIPKEVENKVFDKVKALIDYGILEDTRISLSDDEEDEGILVSEFNDINEDQLNQIIDLQKQQKDKDFEEKYISRDGLNEQSQRLINILKEGGDISDIFADQKSADAYTKRPFEGLNLEEVKDQRTIGMTYLVNNKGLSPEDAALILKKKEENFELDSFAKDLFQGYNKAFDDYWKNEEERRIAEAQEKKKELNKKSETLKNTLTEKKFKKPLIDKIVANSIGEVNGKPKLYNVIDEVLKNPEQHYEVLLHLLDKEAYNELHNIKTNKKTTENVLRLADTVKQASKKNKEKAQEEIGSELEQSLRAYKIK